MPKYFSCVVQVIIENSEKYMVRFSCALRICAVSMNDTWQIIRLRTVSQEKYFCLNGLKNFYKPLDLTHSWLSPKISQMTAQFWWWKSKLMEHPFRLVHSFILSWLIWLTTFRLQCLSSLETPVHLAPARIPTPPPETIIACSRANSGRSNIADR